MLWATRSRRCFSSATRSLSSNAGAGGVMRILDGMALSFPARTPTELSIARHATSANSANVGTLNVFLLFILCLFMAVLMVLVLAPVSAGDGAAVDLGRSAFHPARS